MAGFFKVNPGIVEAQAATGSPCTEVTLQIPHAWMAFSNAAMRRLVSRSLLDQVEAVIFIEQIASILSRSSKSIKD
ncbi:hypothetical protein D3C77_364460 [compost metagenome]